VELLDHFDRPTPLADHDSAADWMRMFGGYALHDVPPTLRTAVLDRIDELAAPQLQGPDGHWAVDYVRLRWRAVAAAS
jgi:hypothetical protein